MAIKNLIKKQQQFEEDWQKVKDDLTGFFFNKGCSKEKVDDLLQDTASKAWKYGYNDPIDFRKWVFTIAYNVYNTYYRKYKSKEDSVEFNEELYIYDTSADPESYAIERVFNDKLLSFLNQEDRSFLIMLYTKQLKYREISDITGKSTSQIGRDKVSVLNKIRDILAKLNEQSDYAE